MEPFSEPFFWLQPSHVSASHYEDSDSDLEDLCYVLDESHTQLKVADHSLKKKRKDPLGTGLHLNPSKYVSVIVYIFQGSKNLKNRSRPGG